jgi:hypothetical protein
MAMTNSARFMGAVRCSLCGIVWDRKIAPVPDCHHGVDVWEDHFTQVGDRTMWIIEEEPPPDMLPNPEGVEGAALKVGDPETGKRAFAAHRELLK